MDSFPKCSLSEALTFGVGHICNPFQCRETCRDEPFSTMRPLSTEADVETEHGGASSCDGHLVKHWNSASRVDARPTCENVQAVCRPMICSDVHEHPIKDFIFCSLLRKHVKSHMILNEGGRIIPRKMFITKRSGYFSNTNAIVSVCPPKVVNTCFASQQAASSEHHHEQSVVDRSRCRRRA